MGFSEGHAAPRRPRCQSMGAVGPHRAQEKLLYNGGTGWLPVPHDHPPQQLTHRASQPASNPAPKWWTSQLLPWKIPVAGVGWSQELSQLGVLGRTLRGWAAHVSRTEAEAGQREKG